MLTGEEYFRQITSAEHDRKIRAAFQKLALRIVKPGASIFDFGCGPGIDAKFYAHQGYSVAAYDVDPGMCGFIKVHCRDELQSESIRLDESSYADFLRLDRQTRLPPAQLVTANFAPLNLASELPQLFAKFDALCAPQARLLLGVLNPYYVRDLRCRWRVANQLKLWRTGNFLFRQLPGIVIRHPDNFAEQAAPYFALERVFKGWPHDKIDTYVPNDRVHRFGWTEWLRHINYMFMFLLFRKCA